MGAAFNSYSLPDSLGRDEIKKRWNAAVDQSRYVDGHCYSGEIGMLGPIASWEDKDFPTRREAEDWLEEKHQKYDSAIAVSYRSTNKKGETNVKFWLIGGWCSS